MIILFKMSSHDVQTIELSVKYLSQIISHEHRKFLFPQAYTIYDLQLKFS